MQVQHSPAPGRVCLTDWQHDLDCWHCVYRLESVSLVIQNNLLEDMLDNEEQMAEQMDALPYLVRFQYDKSAAYIISLFDPLADAFTKVCRVYPAVGSVQKQMQHMSTPAALHRTDRALMSPRRNFSVPAACKPVSELLGLFAGVIAGFIACTGWESLPDAVLK